MRLLNIKVKPNARTSSLNAGEDGAWLARLKSPPMDGKANAELVALVATPFRTAQKPGQHQKRRFEPHQSSSYRRLTAPYPMGSRMLDNH